MSSPATSMSTNPITGTSDDSVSERVKWNSPTQLESAVANVFLPVDRERAFWTDSAAAEENDHSLARAVHTAAHAYSEIVEETHKPLWHSIAKMLDNLGASIQSRRLGKCFVVSKLSGIQTGDIIAFLNRAQDAAVIFRKQDQGTLYESFQTSWDSNSTLAGSYPQWAVKIPDEIFHHQYFQSELANFLLYQDEILKYYSLSEDATTYPKLLTSILRSIGYDAELPRVIKRVYSHHKSGPRLRSRLWLLVKVAIQTSLDRGSLGCICYKIFMLRFVCNLGQDAIDANLSGGILHAISAKILRRLKKLGPSAPGWLSNMVLETSASLRKILEARWKEVEAARPLPPLWNPSQLDLDGDTQLSLTWSKEYVRNSFVILDPKLLGSHFLPKLLLRGTLSDFLSSSATFFEKVYLADPHVTLFDVQQAVEGGIDDWVACVTDVDQACIQLEVLISGYLSSASRGNPEHISFLLLTVIELWIALDKLAVRAVPILADYSPVIPEELLHLARIRKKTSLHRLGRAHRYLSARHSQSLQGQSMFLDQFAQKTFTVFHHEDVPNNVDFQDLRYHVEKHQPPMSPLADLAIFELRCPVSLHVWRSTTACLLGSFPYAPRAEIYPGNNSVPLAYISKLQPFLAKHWTSPLTGGVYLICFNQGGLRPWDIFRDIPNVYRIGSVRDENFTYHLQSSSALHGYVNGVSHLSNGVLATQVECPDGLSSPEFIAFGHLRSGGSLQWINVLRELRSRTLNFRRHDTYLLFTQAVSQLGPLDLDTAEWTWHQELQEPYFCYALLDEVESLLVDIAAHSSDGVMMGIISLLLTRLLASCCYEDISDRAVGLLRKVRTKTFEWVQELSYDLMMAPTNTERSKLLKDMAATCRSTFDVDPAILHKLLYSAEDIEALLSCSILIHANNSIHSGSISEYSQLLLERDRRLSLTIESVLRDVVCADASDRGIDLAVRNVWPGYRPGPGRWQPLLSPNSHWFMCRTAATNNGCSQTVHLNLLDGVLLVDGRQINGLPRDITGEELYKRIFGDQRFLVIPSDLPGMDFTTLAMINKHRVHFSLKDYGLVIRAQHKDTADILEVIPQHKLLRDLPTVLVYAHIHWLNLSTSVIEIRPLEKIWEQSLENWRIDYTSGQHRMYKGHEYLVDIRSPTWKMVSSRLEYLEVPENLIITTFPTDTPHSSPIRRLSVTMPCYGLSFFVNEHGELESHDFKSMVYDENQCIGTLFGLENRVVLRSSIQIVEELVHRCVIIPDGRIFRKPHGHGVRILINPRNSGTGDGSISAGARNLVAYYTYEVDNDLGCLTGHASWRSKIYLAHLHAQTSVDWIPDQLTNRTGIQEALRLFRSAGCRSIMELDTRHEERKFFSDHYDTYPQISFAIQEINYLIERETFLHTNLSDEGDQFGHPRPPHMDVPAMLQTAYLFPLEVAGPIPMITNVTLPKLSEPEDLAHTISLAVYHWVINATRSGVESRNDTKLAGTLRSVPTWTNLSLLPPLFADVDSALEAANSNEPAHKHRWSRRVFPLTISEVEVLLQEAKEARQWFRLLFLLPTTVYRQRDPQLAFLSILVALAKRFPLESPPNYANCQPCYGYRPSRDALKKYFTSPHHHSTEEQLDSVMNQWTAAWLTGTTPTISQDAYLCDSFELTKLFTGCYRNLRLKHNLTNCLLDHVAKLRTSLALNTAHSPQLVPDPLLDVLHHALRPITLGQLFRDRSAPKVPAPVRLRHSGARGVSFSSEPDTHTLNQLFASLRMSRTNPSFQQQYISRLHSSAQHVRGSPCMNHDGSGEPSVEELQQHYSRCRANYMTYLAILKNELGPRDDPLGKALDGSSQWPQITPNTLFGCLASISPIELPPEWKVCLVSLALLLVELQRARRLLRFSLDSLLEEFHKELENDGCDGWCGEEYLDWLLVQLQGNFIIRGIQADVARKLILPPSGQNTVMQVNMGEGKSSVILPISAATLADGHQLVRVIVPKSLSVQMFRLLVGRLGGLAGRPVYHLSFSRSPTGEYSRQQFESFQELMVECMHARGILLIQPEHVLSLKLTCVQRQLSCSDGNANQALGDVLLKFQKWIQSYTRDILDECDEVLHPRFQLIYAVGLQQHMQGYPDRWTITQQILRLVKKHALSLSHDLPDSIEYERDVSGSFPRIRILRASDARQRLVQLTIDDVMNGHLPDLNFRDLDRDRRLRAAVRAFISSKDIPQRTAKMVEDYARQSILWDGILLLRGLLACDILLFALAERRWCVDYGLAPKRTMLAVPYRAKAVPAPKAEFGHPDVMIVLTCLSYYYGGLTEDQLRISFEILQDQDDPSMEYASWLRDYNPNSLPKSIQDISNVNIKSSEQWDKYIFPLFARNQGAVDFYLSRVVFPKEAKEFPWKLAASSWDLAERRERPITGFSGTNDCQDLLPTSVAQRDLDHQRGATARVLSHLLQAENSAYLLISHASGIRRTTLELLEMVVEQKPEIRVFLDIGAQILDLSNYEVANAWLSLSSSSDGAIYFSEDDEAMMLTKDGSCRPLISSPLAQQLDRCIVYLDDAHTRGTDLNFPKGFRAAVTLGPKVTKDRLVQGCMRMRKLGRGHSVMFLAPLEVDGSIRAVAIKEDYNIPVTTTDILRWAIHETWTDIRERAPYWAQQGVNHESRYEAWSSFCNNELTREQLADVWLQPELKSLADLYAPLQPQNVPNCSFVLDDYPEIQQHCIDLGVLKFPEAQMEEEQEREVNREIEREREVQQPLKATPALHSIHPDVVTFVKTGVIAPLHTSSAFQTVFATLQGSLVDTGEARIWSPFVLATTDFCNTIVSASCQGRTEQYLRPVQWVLSRNGTADQILVLVSPFEADYLMPDIRLSKYIHLHVYTPRTSKRMRPADDLMFYSIPPVPDHWTPPWELIDQLNVFPGQLYLRDYDAYLRLRRFLGIQINDPPKHVGTTVRRNRVTPSVLEEIQNTCMGSPLPSVMMLLAIRRRGLPFAETHMGRILQGQPLTEDDFSGLAWATSSRTCTDREVQMRSATSTIGGGGPSISTRAIYLRRGLQMVDAPYADSGRPEKRLRADP